jgi:hypothetical protein
VLEHYGEAEAHYSTDVVWRKTKEFLKRSKAENDSQPFFAYVAPTCPHFPLPPAPRHREAAQRWGYSTFPKNRPNYMSDGETVLDKPQWLRKTWNKRTRLEDYGGRWLSLFGGDLPRDRPARSLLGYHEIDWFNRMGSLMACDEMIADLVTWLKENGEWENTVLVFTSDNGYNLGAHALAQKNVPYEESLRVPLFFSGGQATGIRRGELNSRDWIFNIDLAPTVLDLAELPIPSDMDGESLAWAVRNGGQAPAGASRSKMLIEYYGPSMAEGIIQDAILIHMRLMPAFFLDTPTYEAIRVRRTEWSQGSPIEKTYLYVRWEKPLTDPFFQRRLRKERRFLQRRLERNRPLARWRHARATQLDYELYDISEDPYQLNNLLYYAPEVHASLVAELEEELDALVECQGNGASGPTCSTLSRYGN